MNLAHLQPSYTEQLIILMLKIIQKKDIILCLYVFILPPKFISRLCRQGRQICDRLAASKCRLSDDWLSSALLIADDAFNRGRLA